MVIVASEKRSTLKRGSKMQTWMTLIECVSVGRQALSPMVIFKGASLQEQWFKGLNIDEYTGWKFTVSPNGWSSTDIAMEWLEKVFIPETAPNPPGPKLLLVDGHGTHDTDRFLGLCAQHDICVIFLPPDCSYIVQPLDVSVFGPLKNAYH